MPNDAMVKLDATLDAAATVLATRGAAGDSPRAQAIHRACVVLCTTAWETYAENSILWLADRLRDSTHAAAFLAGAPPAALHQLHTHYTGAEDRITTACEKAGRWKGPTGPEQEQLDRAWVQAQSGTVDLLAAELRRIVLGPYRPNGARATRGAMPAPRVDTLRKMQQMTYGEALIDRVTFVQDGARRDVTHVAAELDCLLTVRNSSVHRDETPEPLDRRGARDWVLFVHNLATSLDGHIHHWAGQHLPVDDPAAAATKPS
ncbi:MAG: hypothetical protein L0I76_34850 [Pseudonocardia sp.]|nr:hypothetical protein [Pseudonocardia sp.]